MLPTTAGGASFALNLPSEQATLRLVSDAAAMLQAGDLITLSGDLGAGKTTFARALIRYLARDPSIAVPSPTFTFIQIYDLPRLQVVHADLYRLSGPGELAELGFDDLPEDAVVLLEWPDRAAGFLPADRLDIAFTLAPAQGPEARNVRVTGYGAMAPRVERMSIIRHFLEESGLAAADRERIQGDASTRSYERLRYHDQNVIMMNAPRRPDGPPVRNGLPYSAIAHLAEDIRPFVALANGLRQRGFSAPEIFHTDLNNGLIVLEDLGTDLFVAGVPPAPVEERYAAAVDFLVALHAQELPTSLPITPQTDYAIPRYDMEALLIEVELLVDWYLPRLGKDVTEAMRAEFLQLWRTTLEPAMGGDPKPADTDVAKADTAPAQASVQQTGSVQQTWVLRDFHSPNLLWLPQRDGIARVGLLDFQDAQIGAPAYDLASLLQDARVDVPEQIEITLLSRYAQARREKDASFDTPALIRLYATFAAQRASKILGIFARLDRRDGKPQYLRHIPRVWGYLQRALAHPALEPLRVWYGANVPPPDNA